MTAKGRVKSPRSGTSTPRDDLPPDPRRPYWHWTDRLVAADLFGIQPTLEMKGKRKFKSCWGAFISMFTFILIVLYSIYQLLEFQKMTVDGQSFVNDMQT